MMGSFMIRTVERILFGWSNQEECYDRGMWHTGREERCV
jgi:hypothetical protein